MQDDQQQSTKETGVVGRPWSGWLGLALRTLGLVGLVLSVAAMIGTPVATVKAIPAVQSGLRIGADTADSMADSLDLAGGALDGAAEVLDGTGETLVSVEQSIANTQPLIEAVAGLVGSTVPITIEGTQRTLETAVQGAHAIDQVLRGLAALGPLTGVSYDPERSLESSLSEAASGLAPIPQALREVQRELDGVGGELDTMRSRLRSTASDLDQFAGDLQQVSQGLEERAADLRQLANGLRRAADSARTWMWGIAVAVELVLLGMAATQRTLYLAGREASGRG